MDPFLQSRLEGAIDRWQLALDGPVRETPKGCMALARRDGQPVVVKVIAPRSDETRAAAALLHFAGSGSVVLLDQVDHATLLERLAPGDPLTTWVVAGRDDEATHQLTAVALVLHRSAHLPQDFPTVEEWGKGFLRHRRTGDGSLSATLVDRAAALFVELAESQTERRLLHGDLHHDNILWDDDRGWVAIDPKGVIGEAAYEFGAAIRNPTDDVALFASSEIVDRRSRIIAEQAGIDHSRIVQWAFAQAVLSAIWSIEDGERPDNGIAAAYAILKVL